MTKYLKAAKACLDRIARNKLVTLLLPKASAQPAAAPKPADSNKTGWREQLGKSAPAVQIGSAYTPNQRQLENSQRPPPGGKLR